MLYKNKNTTIDGTHKTNQAGFSHLIIPIAVVACGIVGTAGLVLKASHHSTAQSVHLVSGQVKTSSTLSSPSTSSPTTATPVSTSTTPSTSTASSSATKSSPTTTSSVKTSTSPAATTSPATTPAAKPTVTPLSVLTGIISGLDAGQSAQVTVSSVAVAGPISTAQARPIVFSANGTTYFAYTQGQKPDFDTSASATASSMAITSASGSYTLTSAYLDKGGILVDPNQTAVGYSSGGD